MTQVTPPPGRTVTLERHLPHPPAKVWRALTEPHLVAEWLMPGDIAATPGHRFELKGDWGSVDCEVVDADPPHTLCYRWRAMGLDSLVTFTLTPAGEGVRLRVEQAGFRDDQEPAFQGARFGWDRFLGRLEAVLGGHVGAGA